MNHDELHTAGHEASSGEGQRRAGGQGRTSASVKAIGLLAVGVGAGALWPTAASLDSVLRGDPANAANTRIAGQSAARERPGSAMFSDTAGIVPAVAMPRSAEVPGRNTEARTNPRRGAEPRSAREKELAGRLDALQRRLQRKEFELAALRAGKSPVLGTLDERSRRGVEHAEKVITLTGLDPQELVPDDTTGHWGGLATVVAGLGPDRFDAAASKLAQRLDRWQRLQQVLRSLPLIAPLDHYRKSSDFGARVHPITGRKTGHDGTDFAYYKGAPVLATAAGKVVFAGRRGGYGNIVEIDHGMGIRTRYAHNSELLVEEGDEVAFRQKIAKVGSTGRSTGPHVHYEVLVKGRPVDPMKFITAGKYAFKPVPMAQVIAAKASAEPNDVAKVEASPKPRAAASMIDRPDSSTLGKGGKKGEKGEKTLILRGIVAKERARKKTK